MAAALHWVSRIFATALMMVLPGVGGQWLDRRWGTRFIGLTGFAVGLVGGVAYLIASTRQSDAARRRGAGQAPGERGQAGDERRSDLVDDN
jgi:hypothetical protein